METISNKPRSEEEGVSAESPNVNQKKARRNWLYDALDFSIWFDQKSLFKSIPFLLYLAVLAMIYIANSHYAEKNMRDLDDLDKQMNQLRWEYMSDQADLENMSKQSQLSGKVSGLGLKTLSQPPFILMKNKNEH